jgi:uncharacterized protein (TIRG00374 family)
MVSGISLLVTMAIFAILFSRITWEQVANLLRTIDRPRVGGFVALSLAMHAVRTYRYRLILKALGQDPGFLRLFPAVLVRALCVDLLPARTGEWVYLYVLKAKLGVELGAATASFSLAIFFDFLALPPLLGLAWILSGSVGLPSWPAWLAAGLGLMIAAAAMVRFLPAALRLSFLACGRLPRSAGKFRSRARRLAASTHRQVRRARAMGVYPPVFAATLLIRLLKYGALYVLLLALLRPLGYPAASLPFPRVFLGLSAAEMAASLPLSGVGGFGAYEGAWARVFPLLGLPADLARASGVAHHLFSQTYGYLLGLIGVLALLPMRPRKNRRP